MKGLPCVVLERNRIVAETLRIPNTAQGNRSFHSLSVPRGTNFKHRNSFPTDSVNGGVEATPETKQPQRDPNGRNGEPGPTNSMNRGIYPRPRRDTRRLFSSPGNSTASATSFSIPSFLLSPLSLSLCLSPSPSPSPCAPFFSFALDDRNYIRSRPATSKYVPRSERDGRQKRFPCYNPRL